MLDQIQKQLLEEVADLHEMPEGAYNIRSNSQDCPARCRANQLAVTRSRRTRHFGYEQSRQCRQKRAGKEQNRQRHSL